MIHVWKWPKVDDRHRQCLLRCEEKLDEGKKEGDKEEKDKRQPTTVTSSLQYISSGA